MTAKNFWRRIFSATASDDLDDFRRDMILSIAVVMALAGWLLLWASLHYRQPGYFFASALLWAGALGSARLRAGHLRGAQFFLLLTMMGAIVSLKYFHPDSPTQYFFTLVVIVSGLLETNLSVFVVATLACGLIAGLATASGSGWSSPSESIMPGVLVALTAFATWLSARQLLSALVWMNTAYTREHRLLEQLRDERASLARTLRQLEDAYQRIEKMNYALIEARGAAEEASRLKAAFAANISHELRTPLNIIIGFSETMANAPETYTGVAWSPILRGDIEQIYQSSRHLLSLIDDILDLSALDMHRLGITIGEAEIGVVIREAAAVVQDLFHAKNLYLRLAVADDLPRLRMDATRIRQVLINLLTNANRFTTAGGVTVTAHLVGHAVEVAVADTGIGIAPEDEAKVFDEFGQVDSSIRRTQEGSGLGVPLSKRLVELHNGRMWLASQPGQGSTFFFTLPTEDMRPGLAKIATGQDPAALQGRRTVLMMEPDLTLLNTVRRRLNRCDVVRVENVASLGELIEQNQPSALIVDRRNIAQPTMDLSVPPDLPVISVRLPNQMQNAAAIGIRDFLIKPVTRERLMVAIDQIERPVRKVLIVNEDPALVELVTRMLQAGGTQFRVQKAWDGSDALAHLRREPVDLILLDWRGKGETSMAVLQEMRDSPDLAAIPVIMVGSEYPELLMAREGVDLRLHRQKTASVSEMVSYLEALVAVLPVRGLPD